MKFDKVVEHLGEHGFITRVSWSGYLVLAFGMDNCLHAYMSNGNKKCHLFCRADILANDWMILPFYWDGPKDDFLPFDGSESSRVWRRQFGIKECEMPYEKDD